MIGKLKKVVAMFGISSALLLSQAVPVEAVEIESDDYIFSMVLYSCGICPKIGVGLWMCAYEGYLESIGDEDTLSLLHGFSTLEPGDSATGMIKLVSSVKEWLSLSPDYLTGSRALVLPSSPSVQLDKADDYHMYSVQLTPFSDCAALPESGYDYLYSFLDTVTYNDRLCYQHNNLYALSGFEYYAYSQSTGAYANSVLPRLCVSDGNGGYTNKTGKLMRCAYYIDDGSLAYKDSSPVVYNFGPLDVRSCMKLPISFFPSKVELQDYMMTGNDVYRYTSDHVVLRSPHGTTASSFDSTIRNEYVTCVNDVLPLPDTSEEIGTVYFEGHDISSVEEMSSFLSSNGLQVVYGQIPITINTQPKSVYRDPGQTCTFSVTASDADVYLWQYSSDGLNWIDLDSSYVGFDTKKLTVNVDEVNQSYKYRCRLSNSTQVVVYTDTVSISPRVPVVVVSQPVNTWAEVGEYAFFEFVVEDAVSYQWQCKDASSSFWSTPFPPSATGDTYPPGYFTPKSSKLEFFGLSENNQKLFWRCTANTETNYVYSDIVYFDESLKPVVPDTPADAVVSSFTDLVGSLRTAIIGILPKALVVCGMVLIIMGGIRFFKKLTSKG